MQLFLDFDIENGDNIFCFWWYLFLDFDIDNGDNCFCFLVTIVSFRDEQIIRYSNIIRILEAEY